MTTQKNIFAYFRMGLVAGIVERKEVVDWADREILASVVPNEDLIELSLCGRQPYSQIVRLLNSLQGEVVYDIPLKMLFQRARERLEQDPGKARNLILGLRLINAEEYLPQEIRRALFDLEDCLERYDQGLLSPQELYNRLKSFFDHHI